MVKCRGALLLSVAVLEELRITGLGVIDDTTLRLTTGMTLEAWVRTTGLGEVVLSTWDGRSGRRNFFPWSGTWP